MSRSLRVLIAEDNPADVELVIRQLRKAGFDPDWRRVETGEEYLKALDPPPDIILSDYSMPQFSGTVALKMLKQRSLDVPFIIVSGTIGEDLAVEMMKLGATDYFLKDRLGRLGQSVGHALEEHRLQAERKRTVESLNLFRTLIDRTLDGIEVIDPETGRILDTNTTTCERLGYSCEEMLTMTVADISTTVTRDSWQAIVDNIRKTGFLITESEHRRKDGSTFPVEINVRYIELNRDYMLAVVRDITERKRVAEELCQREDDLAQAQRVAKLGSWRYDTTSDKVRWSDELFRIFGVKKSCFDGTHESFLTYVLSDDRPKVLQVSAEAKARGTSFEIEYRIQTRAGDVKTIQEIGRAKMDAGGRVLELFGTAQDITEQKRAIKQIAEQAALLDKTQDAIIVRDLQHNVLFWSKGAERLYGWTAEEAMGGDVTEMLYDMDVSKFQEATAMVMKKGEWSGELNQFTKDRRKLTVEGRCTLVRDEEGRPKSVLAIYTDVTERKKIEAQFLRAQRMESIGVLAGGVAHDLNNILSPIMMSIEILREMADDPEKKLILETIETSAQRGADIVGQILSFARGMEGRRVEIQPKHLIRDIEHIIRDTFPKNIRVECDVSSEIWTILGDPTQLHQILLNLCVNARDAMPEGGVLAIRLENRMLDKQYAAMNQNVREGDYVCLEVTDTGTGMPASVVEKIFDPFFTTKEIGKGTGLGLSTVLAIVKSHEGFVSVYSEPGKGTTFRIYFPASTSSRLEERLADQPVLLRGLGETVLIVDDESSILNITGQTLEAFGYRVLTADNGAEAVAVYAQHEQEIALVLTDMMMPFMDGAATIHALLKINPAAKIIAASGLNANDNVSRATSAGVKHFLTKPYTAATLLKIFRTVLDEDPQVVL